MMVDLQKIGKSLESLRRLDEDIDLVLAAHTIRRENPELTFVQALRRAQGDRSRRDYGTTSDRRVLSSTSERDPDAPVYVNGGKIEFLDGRGKLRMAVSKAHRFCEDEGLSLSDAWRKVRAE